MKFWHGGMEQEQEEGYLIYCDNIEGQRISEGEAKSWADSS